MGEEFINHRELFEKPSPKPGQTEKEGGRKVVGTKHIAAAVEVLNEGGDWRELLSNYSRKLSVQSNGIFAIFVVISNDLQFRWTTHQERLSENSRLKYEELLPLNADFGEQVRTFKGPASGIRLIDEISLSTGCIDFTLFRGIERGGATLYLYIGGRRRLLPEEESAFSAVTVIFDSIIKREFSIGEQLAHSARLSAAIELGRQIGDSALASSFLNRAADTIQKKIGIDYAAVMVLDEGRREMEFAGISESLTPLYDTPLSMKPTSMMLAVFGQKDPLIVADTENSGYRPLGVGVKWAALIPLDTRSRRKAMLILESRTISPYDEAELKDIEIVSSLLADRLSTSISISEKDRKILLRNMLLEELLLLHRESDPVKIADESLAFIESVVPSTISVFYVLNETESTLIPVTSRGLFAREVLSFSVPIGEGIVGRAISGDKPEFINDVQEDLRAVNLPAAFMQPESILVIPIKSIKEDIGVITLHRSGKKWFSTEDLEVLSLAARQLSAVLERANTSAEMRSVISEKDVEAALAAQLADEFVSSLREENIETLPLRTLKKCIEVSACDIGMLFQRDAAGEGYTTIARLPPAAERDATEISGEEMEALRKECIHLANNVFILEDGPKIQAAYERLDFGKTGGTAADDEGARRCLVEYHAETVAGGETAFVGIGTQRSRSRQLFRGYLLQKMLTFFDLRNSRMNNSMADSEELIRLRKISGFKDLVYGETDLEKLLEKVAPAVCDAIDGSIAAIYLANYASSSFERIVSCVRGKTKEPPREMKMAQADNLVRALKSRRKVVKVGNQKGDIPFSSFFSNQLLACRVSSMDGADYIVLAGSGAEHELLNADKLLAELLKILSTKVRQLTALNRERHRAGLLNLIDEIARNINKQDEFGRILDALASAAGHLVGAEYSLAGAMSSSGLEWYGYYENGVPDCVERLASESYKKEEDIIINETAELRTEAEGELPDSIANIMIYPITTKDSGFPFVFVLLMNKLGGYGFNENDEWMLERLGSNMIGSLKTMEALKQETLMKRRAEIKKVEMAELLDGIDGGIIRIDSEGRIAFANSEARKILGIDQSQPAPRLVDLMNEGDSLQVTDITDSIKKGERFDGVYTFGVNAQLRRLHVSGRHLPGKGKKGGAVIMVSDEGPASRTGGEAAPQLQLNGKHAEIRTTRFPLKKGFSYMIPEEKPSLAYSTLADLIAGGYDAFVVTREHPSKLREKHKMGEADIRWLTQVVGSGYLDPSKLSVITSAIISFLERHGNAVIFIDGLEYMLANNNTIRVIAMLENVMQKAVDTGAVIIAAINKQTFDQRDLAMIGKLFEELDISELGKRYLNRELDEFTSQDNGSKKGKAND